MQPILAKTVGFRCLPFSWQLDEALKKVKKKRHYIKDIGPTEAKLQNQLKINQEKTMHSILIKTIYLESTLQVASYDVCFRCLPFSGQLYGVLKKSEN